MADQDSSKNEQKMVQLQILQQQMQNVMMQKQTIELQLMEMEKALSELKLSKDSDVYVNSGMILIKKSKKEVEKEINDRKETFELHKKTMDKQEKSIKEKLNELAKEMGLI